MNVRTLAILAAMLALVAIIFFAGSGFDPFGWRKGAEKRAVVAEQQADMNATGAAISDTVATNTAKARKIAGDTRNALAVSTDLDSDLAIWSAGIDGVRDQGHQPAHRRDGEPADTRR